MIADVVVIGGGVSGLAAAVQAAHQGASVALFEQTSSPGGRCYSFRDEVTGDIVDNGQHVLLSAYSGTLRYLTMIGSARYLDRNRLPSLTFHDADDGFLEFDLRKAFSPMNLPRGLLSSSLLKPTDRLKITRMAMEFLRWDFSTEERLRSMTVAGWLASHGQSESSRTRFWHPLAVSIMNELPEKACALPLVKALKEAFFDGGADSTILIPSVGQTSLYTTPALNYLHERRGMAFTDVEAVSVQVQEGRAVSVKLRNGDTIHAGAVVAAVPQYALAKILPPELVHCDPYMSAPGIGASPIISVHLWFDRAFMDRPMIGLLGRTTHWLFDRGTLLEEDRAGAASGPGGYCSATISAGRVLADLPKEAIIEQVVKDVGSIYPPDKTGALKHALVIKEKRATFADTPEAERKRPGVRTPIANFFLAGDWINTGLPPTIEGAIRSGFRAAELCGTS